MNMHSDPFKPIHEVFKIEVMNHKTIGHGNAQFLGDLANGMGIEALRENWKAGKYPGSDLEFIKANLAFWNRG